jgi:Ca-activated chloride channel family protein
MKSVLIAGLFSLAILLEQIDFTESIRNAQINHGLDHFTMQEDDLQIRETDFKSQTSTVLMIDISHSMILYGEDRITPAKTVAMALSELITTKYPKDTLDIVVFGNDAWPVEIKDLPYLQVGPIIQTRLPDWNWRWIFCEKEKPE